MYGIARMPVLTRTSIARAAADFITIVIPFFTGQQHVGGTYVPGRARLAAIDLPGTPARIKKRKPRSFAELSSNGETIVAFRW
jgi:hypothetical protein